MEENIRKAYAMISKDFFPSKMQNIIKEHLKYDSILNDPLKLTYAIAQEMHETIRATYPYISFIKYLARMKNSRQQEKEGSLD